MRSGSITASGEPRSRLSASPAGGIPSDGGCDGCDVSTVRARSVSYDCSVVAFLYGLICLIWGRAGRAAWGLIAGLLSTPDPANAGYRRTMTSVRRVVGVFLTACLVVAPVVALQPPTGAAQDGFVPIDKLPPQEQLPAAPLLITAYVFVWLAIMVYVWSIARRLGKVESEIETLQRRPPGSPAR